MEDYPQELLERPRPVVLLAGCVAHHDRIGAQLSHVLLDPSHTKTVPCFATRSITLEELDNIRERKDRRTSYDGYSPQGLLKADYMKKHTEDIVSVVVLLFYWDSKANAFEVGEAEMTRMIESLRSKRLRSARAAIVIMYEGTVGIEYDEAVANLRKSVDGNSDKGSSSRLRWLTSSSSSSSIGSFALDDFSGSTQRLEKQILELAHQYYKDEAKRIKRDRDILNRRVHPHVFVRNHFKIAFLAEFRADFRSAMKYYTAAYNYLRDVPRDARMLPEIKTIADYINVKLCSLALTTRGGEPGMQEAIMQFQRHEKIYQGLVGKGNEGVHWAWMSRQFRVFGSLLCRYMRSESRNQLTLKSGLLHPGYYFHFAAALGVRRQRAAANNRPAERVMERFGKTTQPVVLARTEPGMLYYGQHVPTTTDKETGESRPLSIDETLDLERVREHNFDHVSANIEMFRRAAHEYSVGEGAATSKRMLANIAFSTASLLISAEKWEDAIQELTAMIELYRAERWWLLLSHALLSRIACAKAMRDTATAVFHTLELMGKDVPIGESKKAELLTELLDILQGQQSALPPLAQPLAIHPDTLCASPLLTVNFRFLSLSVAHGDCALFDLLVTSHFVKPIPFSQLVLSFSLPSLQLDVDLADDGTAVDAAPCVRTADYTAGRAPTSLCLLLLPETPTLFRFKKRIPALLEFTGVARCEKMSLHVAESGGGAPGVAMQWPVLQWADTRCTAMARDVLETLRDPAFSMPALDSHGREVADGTSDLFRCRVATEVVSPEPQLSISTRHLPPALTNEMYRLEILLANEDNDTAIKDIAVVLSHEHATGNEAIAVFKDPDGNTALPSATIRLGSLAPGGSSDHVVYIRAVTSASKRVVKLSASFLNSDKKRLELVQDLAIPVILPVTARCAFFTSHLVPAAEQGGGACLHVGQHSLVRVEVQSGAPFPIEVISCDLDLNDEAAKVIDNTSARATPQRILHQSDKLTTWFDVLPMAEGEDVSLGMFNMRCRRAAYPELLPGFEEVTKLPIATPTLIPTLRVQDSKFSAAVEVPPEVAVGEAFPMTLSIANHSTMVEEFVLTFKESPHFLFTGAVSTTVKVVPHSSHVSSHTVVALTPGKLVLPQAHLVHRKSSRELHDTRQRQFIFVRPVAG